MKTAEQWWIEGRSKTRSETEVVKLLKQIQIDALREAAEIADKIATSTDSINAGRVHFAILSRIKELEKEA